MLISAYTVRYIMNPRNETVRTSTHIVKQLRWNSVAVLADENEDAPARYPVSLESATSCSNSESSDIREGQELDLTEAQQRGENNLYKEFTA
jgi:hypothetical protein